MNKHFLLFCAYLLLTLSAVSAQPGRDQKIYARYKKEINNLKEDTDKVLLCLKFARLIDQPNTALAIIGQAVELSVKLNYNSGYYLLIHLRGQKAIIKYNREIKNLKEDTNKVLRYLNIAAFISVVSPGISLGIIENAKDLSYKLNYARGIELSIYHEGNIAEVNNDIPLAIRCYSEAAKMAESHKQYADIDEKHPEVYEIYNSCLNLYYYQADYPAAMDIAQKGLSFAEQLNDKERQAHFYNQIGFIYQKQENAEESIKYYIQYLNLANEIHNKMMIADAFNGIAGDYLLKKEYKTSLAYFFKAYNIYNKIKKAANGREEERFDVSRVAVKHERLAYTLFKISNVYKLAGNYKQALKYSLPIFEIYKKRKVFNSFDLAAYDINAGEIYWSLKNYKQAKIFLNQGLSLARSIRHREDMRDAYDALAKTYAGEHKYDSAYIYSTLHTQLKDSIINEESSLKIANMQARYDTEKKDRELAAKTLVRNIFIISILILVTVLFLTYSRYLLQQKNKFQSQVNKQKTELFNAVVFAQDNERKRIAQDIHDSLGSVLSAAKLNLSGLEDHKTRFTKGQKEKYETALGLLDDASAELRNISHNLMPATLLRLGLTAALQNLFDKISATGINISFTAHGIYERLDEGLEISIYRIILELVNNVVKHAKAGEVTVQLIKYPAYINITVEDDGRGFIHTQMAAHTKGMGLNSISSRIEYLNGTMDIDSGIGTGTTVIIDIPLDGSTHSMA